MKSIKSAKGLQRKNQTFEILNVHIVINHIYPILHYIHIVNKNTIQIIIQEEIGEDLKKTQVKEPKIKIYMIHKLLAFSLKKKELVAHPLKKLMKLQIRLLFIYIKKIRIV